MSNNTFRIYELKKKLIKQLNENKEIRKLQEKVVKPAVRIQQVKNNLFRMQIWNDYVYSKGNCLIGNCFLLMTSTDSSDPGLKIAEVTLFREKSLSDVELAQAVAYLKNYHFGEIALPLTFDSGSAWLDNP